VNSDAAGAIGLTQRLLMRIATDFPKCTDEVVALLEQVESGSQDRERVLAAVVLGAAGNQDWLVSLIDLSQQDWRVVLVSGGLAYDDWPEKLDRILRS
jgi:hypothetical protein